MTAEELIRLFDLEPHPEGGWYRETFRSAAEPGERAAATAVYYVIQPGQRSQWNRVDADEIWLWHSGDPLELSVAKSDSGRARTVRLGGRVGEGEQPQVIVPKGHWQSAVPVDGGQAGYTFCRASWRRRSSSAATSLRRRAGRRGKAEIGAPIFGSRSGACERL